MNIFQIAAFSMTLLLSVYIFIKIPERLLLLFFLVVGSILTLVFRGVMYFFGDECTLENIFLLEELGCGAPVVAACYCAALAIIYRSVWLWFKELINK